KNKNKGVVGELIGKVWVDTGAQYIHGASVENPIYCLLNTSGLLSQVPPDEGSTVYYRRDGQRLSEDLADRVYEAGEGIFRQRGNNSGRSLGEHFKFEIPSINCMSSLMFACFSCMFQMVEKLAEDVPKERLLLNKAVSKIEWDGSFSGTDSQVYPVRVLCGDGGEILADHVIVTVSLGCLKAQAASLFSPSLPAEKMEVIDKLSFGNIAKIFLEYEEAFWESDVNPCFLNCYDDCHCLCFFPGNLNIPPPKSVLQTRWRRNNFTHGSYTYIPVGVDGQVMDVLAQPLDLQVLFSGEATIKTQYSTVQGALLSGHRDAERLAQLYGRTAPPAVHCNNHI
uniref:Polyamine oxidase (exo-N4-amino) 1 n=1 Tax=Astyanax mexicanus TaxID=7994 RepID=A0A8B9JGX9_ASTMX